VDRLTRKELKTDKFAVEVGQTLEFIEEHRKPATIIGIAVVVVALVSFGYYMYSQHKHSERQAALREALRTFEAEVGPVQNPFVLTIETQEEKDESIQKLFGGIVDDYPGSDEAAISKFYLGLTSNRQGNTAEAEKYFQETIEGGNDAYASQASFSLAQLYAGQGKTAEAKELLQGLMESPSVFVSKEQATIAYARLIGPDDPDEARKLLEPLRTERSAVSRAALTALGELPQQ
jgi:hypothetical protein